MTVDLHSPSPSSVDPIVEEISNFVISTSATNYDRESLPKDESLLEFGVLDSGAIIELVVFVEEKWKIEIDDEDLTKESMGSINRLANLVREKLAN